MNAMLKLTWLTGAEVFPAKVCAAASLNGAVHPETPDRVVPAVALLV